MTPDAFIQPDPELETLKDPNEKLRLPIFSGYKSLRRGGINFLGRNRIFDDIFARLKTYKVPYEDQCSAQYYFDLVQTLRDFCGEYDRVVEVGVYMGGSTTVFAGCAERFDYDLDLVDINAESLLYAYERARRLFPDAAGRIRLFHGDLPAYVNKVLLHETIGKCVVHHDGAHDFKQVVKDMASLSFVRDKLHAVIAQDTNLRGSIEHMNFVDMALYAVFGLDLNYAPIGVVIDEADHLTSPNNHQGNYILPGHHEGFVLPMAMNEFHYPHPRMALDSLLSKAA
jgi:hypothetical protein